MDCFARKYPERAQLLSALIEQEGYDVKFHDEPDTEFQTIERQLDEMRRDYFEWHGNSGGHTYSPAQRRLRSELEHQQGNLIDWSFDAKTLHIHSRINKNIDKFNWMFGADDADLINHFPTNDEGAKWLNAVMGDWMSRSGIPGASDSEEFTDSFSSRIAWGTLNVVFGAVEVVGGIAVALGSTALTPVSGGTSVVGIVTGGAMTLAGFEAITQGFDMWRTPNEASHGAGWLDPPRSFSTAMMAAAKSAASKRGKSHATRRARAIWRTRP
ncbi:hypothetical protein [Ascidiaceihabitans sp.]|uniref:hypothetical protein n=1 Tax=Ascidiaceihabitans sp. TaxID=1872644 RepID=UPI0032976399